MAAARMLHLRRTLGHREPVKTTRADLPSAEPDAPDSATTLTRTKNQDRDRARQRMEIVARLYIDERLPLDRIVERLATHDLPILVSRATVSRDLACMRRENRRLFNPRRFDAITFVLEKVAVYESLVRKCIKDAHHTRDTRARVMAYRAAAEINERITNLLADSGFIDRRIGTLVVDDEHDRIERIPSGVELQRLFTSVVVTEDDLVSAAEKAWNYGDAVEAEAAAREATAGTAPGSNGSGNKSS
jgi:hypothetical protein